MCTIICSLTEYIRNNTKDFINICFWIFTGILALITYINAKKTLFNPIRSEMVKYQMKVITDFIDNHTSKGFGLDFSIDYSKLIKINVNTDYFIDIFTNEQSFDDHIPDDVDSARLKYCKENLAGLFEITKKNDTLNFDSTLIGDFEIIKQYVQTKLIKQKEQNNNDLILQRFYFTNRFYALYSDLRNLETNPFVPKKIKVEAQTVRFNILKNVQTLYSILSVYISKQEHKTYQDLLSEFNSKKIDHEKDLEKLRKTITRYFKVNEI